MTSDDGKVAWIKTNRGVATCVAVICAILLAYLFTQDWVYQQQRDGFRLGFFSVVGAGAMLICAVAMLFDRLKNQSTPEILRLKPKHWLFVLIALGVCYAYFYMAWNIDFLIVSPFFLGAGAFALGIRPYYSAFIAGIVVSCVIFFLFRLIGIQLPSIFFL